MELIVFLLVLLVILAIAGGFAVSPLLWIAVIALVLYAFLGRGRYYGPR